MRIMKHVALRLCLWILPLWVLLTMTAWLIGKHLQAQSAITTTCALPCWEGLVPGETEFSEVIQILRTNLKDITAPPVLTGSLISFGAVYLEQPISGLIFYNRGLVGTIRLHLNQPFSYLIDALGTPDCVWLSQPAHTSASLIIHWEIGDLFVRTLLIANESKRLTPDMPALDLDIGLNDNVCGSYALPWLGFAPVWRYQRYNPAS